MSGKDAEPAVAYFFFFNDTATTEIYTLSLHDALPILWVADSVRGLGIGRRMLDALEIQARELGDRKSTRLNSSHSQISYAVFCLKKKKIEIVVSMPDPCDILARSTLARRRTVLDDAPV